MITAIVFIQAEVSQLSEIAEQIADIDGVSEVYSVTGELDLVAMVRVREIDDVAAVVADQAQQGRRCPVDPDPDRLPRLQPARSRRRLQHRPVTLRRGNHPLRRGTGEQRRRSRSPQRGVPSPQRAVSLSSARRGEGLGGRRPLGEGVGRGAGVDRLRGPLDAGRRAARPADHLLPRARRSPAPALSSTASRTGTTLAAEDPAEHVGVERRVAAAQALRRAPARSRGRADRAGSSCTAPACHLPHPGGRRWW